MHLASRRQKNISMEVKDRVDRLMALVDALKTCKSICSLALPSLFTPGHAVVPNADLKANQARK